MKIKLPYLMVGYKPIPSFYCLLFILFSILLLNSVKAQVHLVKDINTAHDPNDQPIDAVVSVNETVFFKYNSTELWKTDGTLTGTIRVKKFDSLFFLAGNLNGTLLLIATDSISGSELWKTDGTEAGTVKVKDINPGSASSGIISITTINDIRYFIADDGTSGPELWKTDGTEAGTVKVKDVRPGILGSGIIHYNFVTLNNILYFLANDGIAGLEPWRSDGTSAGTYRLKDVAIGKGQGNISNLTVFNNKIFFVANNTINGYEVWVSDGTDAGTVILKDIFPGKTGSAPNYLTVSGDALYFMAKDPDHGQEIWKTDGTLQGTVLVKDLFPGASSSFPKDLFNGEGTLYFTATVGGNNFEIWKSDGTETGTSQVTNYAGRVWLHSMASFDSVLYFQTGGAVYKSDGTPSGTKLILGNEYFYQGGKFIKFNNSMYYLGLYNDFWKLEGNAQLIIDTDGKSYNTADASFLITQTANQLYFVATSSLWRSDGTIAGTYIIKQSPSNEGSNPSNLTSVNDILYFNALNNEYDYALWKSDGTKEGTVPLGNVNNPRYITNVNGTLYFNSYGQLGKSDGTASGSKLIPDTYLSPINLINVNGTLYFKGYHYLTGYELWKSDGTTAGTTLVKDICAGGYNSNLQNLTVVDSVLYFTANDNINGEELWRIKDNGAILLRDINPGVASSFPQNLVAHNHRLYFVASNGTNGFELWRSNGTKPGTVMVLDINSSDPTIVDVKNLKSINGILYFAAQDADGWALWRSNSTVTGTVKVKDFLPGDEYISIIGGLNNETYVLVGDANLQYSEIWKTNGKESGTVKITTINGLASINTPLSVVKDGILYIQLPNQNDNSGYQLWRTDGTECGTFKIPYEGNVNELTLSGNTLFFPGEFGQLGTELLRLEPSEITPPACVPQSLARSETFNLEDGINQETSDGLKVSSYPNPFTQQITLRVNDESQIQYDVSIINMKGATIETHQTLNTNTNYTLGTTWNSGIYLLKLNVKGKITTRKVMKH